MVLMVSGVAAGVVVVLLSVALGLGPTGRPASPSGAGVMMFEGPSVAASQQSSGQ